MIIFNENLDNPTQGGGQPGMMTGKMLAGVEPTSAVRYQIVIYFTIAAGTALACIGIILLAFRVLFSAEHQLRLEWLEKMED